MKIARWLIWVAIILGLVFTIECGNVCGPGGENNMTVELLAVGELSQDVNGTFRYSTDYSIVAGSFLADDAYYIENVKLPMDKVGSPTGDCWVEIHSSQDGTSATVNSSANLVGQASDTVDVSTLTTTTAWVTFTFSGTIPVVDDATTNYIVLYCDTTISTDDYLQYNIDITSETTQAYKINSLLEWSVIGSVWDPVFIINGVTSVSLSDTLTEDITVSEIIRHSTTVQTNYAYYLLGDDGDVYEYSDEFKGDAGVTITKQYITKNTDLTDQGASPSDIFKTVYSTKLFYKDLDSSVGVTLSISIDDGTTWESSPTGTKSLGTGSGGVKTATWNFPGGKAGQFFKWKLESGSTTTRIQWLGLEVEYEEGGPHFNV